MASVELTVVVPVYRNAAMLAGLHQRLIAVLEPLVPFEVLFVDDCCPEGSRAVLERLAAADLRVAVLVLDRNVGQHRAVLAGLACARGEWVVTMDGDLQDPPEAIPDLLRAARAGAPAVFAGRRGAYESPGRLATSRLFKRLLHRLCGVPVDAGLFVLLHRSLVSRLLELGGPRPFVVAMIGCTGVPSVSIPVSRIPRPSGASSYNGWDRLISAASALVWVALWRARLIRPGSPRPRPAPVKVRLGQRFTEMPSEAGRR